jgi:hypothetical protein
MLPNVWNTQQWSYIWYDRFWLKLDILFLRTVVFFHSLSFAYRPARSSYCLANTHSKFCMTFLKNQKRLVWNVQARGDRKIRFHNIQTNEFPQHQKYIFLKVNFIEVCLIKRVYSPYAVFLPVIECFKCTLSIEIKTNFR